MSTDTAAAANAKKLSDLDPVTGLGKSCRRDKVMLHQRKVALIECRVKSDEILCNGKPDHRIAQELEHFVRPRTRSALVGIREILKDPRTMRDRPLKELDVAKTVPDNLFEVAEIR